MTGRAKKYLVIAAGALLLGLAILVVLAKVLITPERIRMALIPRAEQALHREVEIGDVDISIFSGITVKDFIIREKSPESVFVSAGEVSLRYQFWPLLWKRVVIDEIRLIQPQIRLERMADGSFNFSDLLASADKGREPEETAKSEEPQRSVDLLVATILVENGSVTLVDHASTAGDSTFRYQVGDVNLRIDDLSLEKVFPFSLEARLGEAPLSLDGNADLEKKAVRARISLKGFDVHPFKPYYVDKVPGQVHGMLVDMELDLAGDARHLDSSGEVVLHRVDLDLAALPDAPLRNAELDIRYAAKLDQSTGILELSESRVSFNSIPVTLEGGAKDISTSPVIDLTCRLPELELRRAIAALPEGLAQKFADLDPAGSLSARLSLAGGLDKGPAALLKDGEIRFNLVQASLAGQRSALNGRVSLRGDTLYGKDLAVAVGQNRANLDLAVTNFLAKPVSVTTALTAQRINLDALMERPDAHAGSGEGAPKEKKPETEAGKERGAEIGPFDFPLRLKGTAKIDQALYKGLTIKKLQAKYRLENNVFFLDDLVGQVAEGSFSETARVDLGKKGLEYTARLSTRGIQADPLVSAFFPRAAGTVFGGLDLDLALAGKGTRPADIRRALTANGDLLLQNAKLTGAGLAEGLAGFLDISELREIDFEKAKGQFAVKNGKIAVDSAMAGKKLQLFPKGSVGLDGSLDLDLGLRLSPQLLEKLGRGGKFPTLLKDEEGWAHLPLNVAGTTLEPRFAVDSSALKAGIQEKAREKLRQTLQEKLFDKGKKEAAAEEGTTEKGQESREPTEKLLEGVFKGLFDNN